MARYTGPVCRLCRREGAKLYLKGDRCYSDKCAIDRRGYAPGMHGQGRKKISEYGIQLRENKRPEEFTVFWKNSSGTTLLKLTASPGLPVRICSDYWKEGWTMLFTG